MLDSRVLIGGSIRQPAVQTNMALTLLTITTLSVIGGLLFFLTIFCIYKRYRRNRQTAQLIEWTEVSGSLSEHSTYTSGAYRSRDSNSNFVNNILEGTFSEYCNEFHGFKMEFPSTWECLPSSSPNESLIVHFTCPVSDSVYQRFSVVCASPPFFCSLQFFVICIIGVG